MRRAEHFEHTQHALRARSPGLARDPRRAQRLVRDAEARATQGIWVGSPEGTVQYLPPREQEQPPLPRARPVPRITSRSGERPRDRW